MKFKRNTAADLILPEGKDDRFVSDDDVPGFGVRLQRDRRDRKIKRSWAIVQRVNGVQRRQSFGDVRKMELEDARKAARKWFAQIQLGVDPAVERAKARAQAAATKLTLGATIDRYLDIKRDVWRPSTYKAAKHYFEVDWKPFHARPLDGLKRAEVAA